MKKICAVMMLLFAFTALRASVGITNEVSAAKGYISYSLGVSTDDEPFSINGTLDLSGSEGHNFTFGAGAGGYYTVNDNLSFNLGVNYTGNTSYPVYKTIITFAKDYYVSYKQTLKAWSINPGVDAQIDFFKISPYCGVTFNGLGGYLEIDAVQGAGNYTKKIAESNFVEYAPGTGISFKLPEKFRLSMGGTVNFYNVNVREILDAGTSTITARSQTLNQEALKTAVTFNDFSLSTGLSKTIDDLYLKVSLNYSKYRTPSAETAFGHSAGITLAGSYDINDNCTLGLKLEGSRSYYTDGTFANSAYIYLDADFYITGEEKTGE